MLVGHSQGGFQVVKVLQIGRAACEEAFVWNPLT
jgi:hypothetical protein